ncbi:MAG: glycosyltransferase family 2 protein, partial [Solirubrobacteraceae bacterium]
MKLVMTLVVRNEADIIKTNLDYHLANGVDFVIVTDHGSDDGTSEILHEFESAGVAQVICERERAHHQSRRMTRMAEMARCEHGADWVINNDADEFWWPQVGSLQDVFAALPERYAQVVVQRRNFRPLLPTSRESPQEPFYRRQVYRETCSPSIADLPKVAHRPRGGVVVAPGNHSVVSANLPAVPVNGLLEIFHFPMRSYEQFERKVIQIGLGYELLTDRSPGIGHVQLDLLELHREGRLREHYDALALDSDAIMTGLRAGTIVCDRRLRDFMRDHPLDPSRPRPEAPFAREMLEDMMGTLVALEDEREAAVRVREERERWRTEAEDLTSRVAHLKATTAELTADLNDAHNALHLLRTSRLMRSTTWLRRLYYRARKP